MGSWQKICDNEIDILKGERLTFAAVAIFADKVLFCLTRAAKIASDA